MDQARPHKQQQSFKNLDDESFIRLKQLIDWQIVPFSASTLWRLARRGRFPPAEHVTDQITAWRVKAIRCWAADPGGYNHSTLTASGKTQKEKS